MANVFIPLPVPAANGVGAWVDVSSQGPERTIVVDGGAFDGQLTIEGSNDGQASAVPTVVAPVTSNAGAPQTFLQAWNFLRVRRSGSSGVGSPNVNVSAPAAVASVFAAMTVPPGDGVGAPTSIAGGGDVNTFGVTADFTGSLAIETSADGVNFTPTMLFASGLGGAQNFVGVLSAARVRRTGSTGGAAPLVSVGSSATSGAAGGGFPGYGPAPPAIAAAGAAGAAGTVSRSDHTHAGTPSVNGAAGAATFASAGGTVAVTGAPPALNLEVAVPFPGLGGAPPAVAAASAAGAAGTVSRSDHTHAGTPSVNGAAGAATFASAGGTVAVTGAPPALNLEVAAPFPGLGGAPPAIAAASAAGAAATVSRSDHTHQGVKSVTPGTGMTNSGTALDPVLNVSPSGQIITVANNAALAALASGSLGDGTFAFVQTYKAYFQLVASAQGALANVRVAASGNAGHLWERIIESPDWAGAASWFLDPANSTALASDENSGATALLPLLTYSELARRLTNATIAGAVAVSVASTQQAGDVPVFTVNVTNTGSFTFTGALTSIYTGQVTTYVAGAAAPSTDDGYTMIDNTIPVSFTASGLLADAVLFKRTNGTAAYWWAAKDMGGAAPAAKLRISVPVTATGRTAIALANGDTYQAFTMPQIVSPMRFVNSQGQVINAVIFQQFDWNFVIERAPNAVEHVNCFERALFYSGTCFANSAFKGGVLLWPGGISPANHWFGLIRSGAQLTVAGGPVSQWNGRLVCQNGTIHPNESSFQFAADLAIYDLAAGSGLVADYWSVVFFQAGAICGNNNAGTTVVWANKWSQITFLVGSLSAAGTFTGATPYSVGGTTYTPAQIDAGTANQLATKGNGIYPTA